MKQSPLEYSIKIDNNKKEIKLFFQDEYFAKISKDSFKKMLPEYFYLKPQSKSFKFILQETHIEPSIQLNQLSQKLKTFMSSIYVIRSKGENKKKQIIQIIINLMKKVQPTKFYQYYTPYMDTDLIYCQKQIASKIIKSLKCYLDETLLFSLDERLKEIQQKCSLSIIDNAYELIKILIDEIEDKVMEKVKKFYLQILKMEGKVLKKNGSEPHMSILLRIRGNFANINQFYLQLQKIIKGTFIKVVKITQINCKNVQQVLVDNTYLLQNNILLILDELVCQDVLIRSLKTKEWILDESFSEQDIEVLERQNKNNNLKREFQKYGIYWERLSFRKRKIKIKCQKEMVRPFLEQCKSTISKFKKIQCECIQFTGPLIKSIFMKYFLPSLQSQYYIKFHEKNGTFFQKNFAKDTQKINEQILSIKQTIHQNVITFPWVKPLSCPLTSSIKQLNKQKQYPILYELKDKDFCLQIISLPISRIYENVKQFVLMVNNYQSFQSEHYCRIIQNNKINLDKFIYEATTPKFIRLKEYFPLNTRYATNILLFYVETQRNNRYLKDQIFKLLQSCQQYKTVNFIFLTGSQALIQSSFSELLKTIMTMKSRQEIKIQTINIFYETHQSLECLQRQMRRISVKRVMKPYLDPKTLLRIHNLHEYRLFYSKQQVGSLGSFIFNLEWSKQNVKRTILTIPQEEYGIVFVMNIRQNRIYRIQAHTQVCQYEGDGQIDRMMGIIDKYFNIEYFVWYGKRNKESEYEYCYNFYMANKNEYLKIKQIQLNIEQEKFLSKKSPNSFHCELKHHPCQQYYVIQTYQQELPNIISQIQF